MRQDERFLEGAELLEDRTAAFLADVIERPSLSRREHDSVPRIGQEMTDLEFDEVIIDGFGSVIGRIGDGPVTVVYDSHIDVVDVGDLSQWASHPFRADVRGGVMNGRGASDNKAAIATMVPGGALIKRLDIDTSRFTLYVIGAVQEEDCDGLALEHILTNVIQRPEIVVLRRGHEPAGVPRPPRPRRIRHPAPRASHRMPRLPNAA